MALMTYLQTRTLLAGDFALWSQVSAAWHESLVVSGALLAATSALVANLFTPGGSMVATPLRPRTGTASLAWPSFLLATWATVGHACGLIPVEVDAARRATHGTLNPWDVLIGVVGIFVLCTLGYCAGTILGSVFFVPVIGLLVFVLLASTQLPVMRPLGLVLPVRGFVGTTRFQTATATALYSAIVSVAVVVAAIAGASWISTRKTVRSSGPSATACAGTALTLLLVAFVWRPETSVVARPVPVGCRDSDGVRICLHQADEGARPAVESAVRQLRRAGLGAEMKDVTDEAAADRDLPGVHEALVALDPGPRAANYYAADLTSDILDQIATRFIGAGCVGRPGATIKEEDLLSGLRNRVLALTTFHGELDSPETSTESSRVLARMNGARIAELMRTREREIRTCSLKASQLR